MGLKQVIQPISQSRLRIDNSRTVICDSELFAECWEGTVSWFVASDVLHPSSIRYLS